MSRLRLLALSFAVATIMASMAPTPARAVIGTGPYSLPFFGPTIRVTQPFGCTGVAEEPTFGSCADWHNAIDYNTGTGPVVASNDGEVWDIVESNQASGCGTAANKVVLKHMEGGVARYTLYYHIAPNSVIPGLHTLVHGGQRIATSGSTGTCAAHLHYSYHTGFPLALGNALDPDGHWTTNDNQCCQQPGGGWPAACNTTGPCPNLGRVPWLWQYVSEEDSNGWSMLQYTTHRTWVKFKNIGGRAWTQLNTYNNRGRTWIHAVTSAGNVQRSSVFYDSADWGPYNYSPGPSDSSSVAYGQTATFTFNMYASSAGTWTEYFNLAANGQADGTNRWYFDYSVKYWIQITVTHCC
jgi:murein DD-endopeptidase MepM/ murein hydrolase activator NlpD